MSSGTVRSSLKWAHEQLRIKDVDEARLGAEILLSHVLELERFKLYLQPDLKLTPEQESAFQQLVARRGEGVPVQHLLGQVSFMGYPLRVTSDVLIPRFETEVLVERALARLPQSAQASFLDAGTGSGAIAIALAQQRPQAQGVALDVSPAALEVARQNARLNKVEDQLTFLQSDWLAAAQGAFDLIVSNPPYIASDEIAGLAPEVRDHDPPLALDGGPDGLDLIRTLIDQARAHLLPQGWLLLEVGHNQAATVAASLSALGYTHVSMYADLSGVERIVEAQWGGA